MRREPLQTDATAEPISTGPEEAPRSHDRIWTSGLPVLAAAVCAVIALATLGSRDLWLDEAFSVTSTNQLLDSLQQRSGSMALYYVLLTPWAEISIDPFWIRLPSVLFAAAGVGLTVAFAVRFFGRQVGLLTAAFLIPMWGVVRFAQEGRSYSLLLLLSLASWWLFLELTAREDEDRPRWALWGLVGAGLVYAHPLGGLMIAGQVIVTRLEHRDPRAALRRALPGLLTLGVLLVPMLITFGQATGAAPTWIEPLGRHSPGEMAKILAGPIGPMQVGLSVALVAATVRVVTRTRSPAPAGIEGPARRWRLKCLIVWLWLPPIALVLISVAQPIVRDRYLISILPAAAMIMALAISSVPSRWSKTGLASLVVLMMLPGQVSIQRDEGHPWSEAVALIEAELTSGTDHGVLFLSSVSRHPFELAAAGGPLFTATTPLNPADPWGTHHRYFQEVGLRDLQARAAPLDVVWLVEQRVPLNRNQPDPPHWTTAEPLEGIGWCVREVHELREQLSVTRFTHCSTEAP